MKSKKVIQFLFGVLFLVFLFSYFVENSGYYEYNLANRKRLTDEQIQQFEQDVKEGKDIDLDNYLENTYVDYSNHLTRRTSEVSLKLNEYLKKIISSTMHILEKLVE